MTKNILTVDDSRTIRDMLRMTLNEAGYNVIQADDGQAGAELLESCGPLDLIITDINMPRMDGYGLISAVRQHHLHKATPILVLTTENGPDKKQRARDAGATGWIVKPFEPARLLAAVTRVSP